MSKKSLRVFSRHPSHAELRNKKLFFDKLCCFRLGSVNQGTLSYDIEINPVAAVKNSSNKLLMKQCFTKAGVKTAEWIHPKTIDEIQDFFEEHEVIVSKSLFGSRGKGNTLLKSHDDITRYFTGKDLNGYIVEAFKNYSKEYRLHVTKDGCFYTCRKMLKADTPKENRWYRNDSNSSWILETNADFAKPSNWDAIVNDCVKALNAVGLDVGAMDVKVQSEKEGKRKDVSWVVIEVNSAPSFGQKTLEEYIKIIPQIIKNKS